MIRNVHEEARKLMASGEGVGNAGPEWLRVHLEQCQECRQYAHGISQVVRTLRSTSFAADSRLVRATQIRMRFHAHRLQAMRRRLWLFGLACLGAGLSATLTAPFLWRLFAWFGAWSGVPNIVWQAGFMFFFLVPGLVVAVLLLGRGANLIQHGEDSPR